MFLHLLTEDVEKNFFLSFAYLLAVAEEEKTAELLPVHSYAEEPQENEYEFMEFVPGFPMQTKELLMLRQFAGEMGVSWRPVMPEHYSNSLDSCHRSLWGDLAISTAASPQTIEEVASRDTIVDMLAKATELQGTPKKRQSVLNITFDALLFREKPHAFNIEKRKAILMEATALCYADGSIGELEQSLLVQFCNACNLDAELIDDFKEATERFMSLQAYCLDIITE